MRRGWLSRTRRCIESTHNLTHGRTYTSRGPLRPPRTRSIVQPDRSIVRAPSGLGDVVSERHHLGRSQPTIVAVLVSEPRRAAALRVSIPRRDGAVLRLRVFRRRGRVGRLVFAVLGVSAASACTYQDVINRRDDIVHALLDAFVNTLVHLCPFGMQRVKPMSESCAAFLGTVERIRRVERRRVLG